MNIKHPAYSISVLSLCLPLALTGEMTFADSASTKIQPPANAKISVAINNPTPPNEENEPRLNSDQAVIQWSDLKDYPFEGKSDFLEGLRRLENAADAQINDIFVKRSGLNSGSEAAQLDQTLREITSDRFFFHSMSEQMSTATAANWTERKAKVGMAWSKMQEALARIAQRQQQQLSAKIQ